MGSKKNRIINEKTSVIRQKPAPPPAPPARQKGERGILDVSHTELMDKITTSRQDAINAVDEVANSLEFVGVDPATKAAIYNVNGKTAAYNVDGTVAIDDPGAQDTGYGTVLDLHNMLRNTLNDEEKDNMGCVPPKRPSIRKPSDAEMAKEAVKLDKLRVIDQEKRIAAADDVTLTRLRSLAIHQEMTVQGNFTILRVPGGLIYYNKTGYGASTSVTSTFVPAPQLG